MINPDIPLDEQTDALPYDVGWEFPVGNLKLGMLLGQGAFGRVLKGEAMNIEEGVAVTTVAVKTVRGRQLAPPQSLHLMPFSSALNVSFTRPALHCPALSTLLCEWITVAFTCTV